jgi:hypothetical protein
VTEFAKPLTRSGGAVTIRRTPEHAELWLSTFRSCQIPVTTSLMLQLAMGSVWKLSGCWNHTGNDADEKLALQKRARELIQKQQLEAPAHNRRLS